MKATELEFRQRFWFIVAVYAAGFGSYTFDHVNAGQALAQWILGHSLQSSADGQLLKAVFTLAALFAALAAAVRTWAAAYLQSELVHDHKLHAECLVADGPYRYVRNPLYLGGILLGVSFGALASRVGFFVISIGLSLFYIRLIGREEAALLESQGESYRQFLAAVPSLLPSLRPRLPSGGVQARWGQAFLGEIQLWLFAACIVAFAATLKPVVLYVSLAAAFAAYAASMALLRRRRHVHESVGSTR